jgi:methyltransferase-like protein/SAM-dependent methyltransferase
MSSQTAAANTYDEVPFPRQPLPQSHPDRLATVATLFGMRPQPIDRCRVLELGCATGSNLVPMAERHPQSRFVGIDYSQRQIAEGRQAIEALGLKNIELRHVNIMDVDDTLGQFDYIIAHGVLSWVAPDVQEKVLSICKSRLNPQGVAYVSYNIYPGWHLRNVIRELVFDGGSTEQGAAHRISRSRRVLEFFSATLADDPAPYSRLLKNEIDAALRQPDGYLYHEYLEDENHSLYFHEFVARAEAHQLQYLGDATPARMFTSNFPPAVEQNLLLMSNDVVSIEQHMDLLKNRAFRQSLLCHQDVSLSRKITPVILAGLRFAGKLRPENRFPDFQSTAVEKFVAPSGATISSPSPLVKAALYHVNSQWPCSVSLEELIVAAAARLGSEEHPGSISPVDRQNLGHNLVQCLANGLVEAYSEPDCFVATISRCPRAGRLARMQAYAGPSVTNRRHEPVVLDEVSKNLLHYLDGEHDREALMKILIAAVNRGDLSILKNGIPASRGEAVADMLEIALEQSMIQLALQAVLVA